MTKSSDYFVDIVSGNASSGGEVVHKFGRNNAVGTTFVPVSIGGIYQTPQVAGATTLRIAAGGNAADTAAGAGAREVTLEGLNASGARITETLATAGASASASTSQTFVRLYRAYVSSTGTYATVAAGSHTADVVIENTAGTADWATIDLNGFARGQSEIGLYTVPLGKTAYIMSIHFAVDSVKTTEIIIFKRENILETAAPYTPLREVLALTGLIRSGLHDYEIPLGPFPELTDIGVLARVSSTTSETGVTFEILLKDKE